MNECLQALLLAKVQRSLAARPPFIVPNLRQGAGVFALRTDTIAPATSTSWAPVRVLYDEVAVSQADIVRWELDRNPAKNREHLYQPRPCALCAPGIGGLVCCVPRWACAVRSMPGPLLKAARANHPDGQTRSEALLFRSLRW